MNIRQRAILAVLAVVLGVQLHRAGRGDRQPALALRPVSDVLVGPSAGSRFSVIELRIARSRGAAARVASSCTTISTSSTSCFLGLLDTGRPLRRRGLSAGRRRRREAAHSSRSPMRAGARLEQGPGLGAQVRDRRARSDRSRPAADAGLASGAFPTPRAPESDRGRADHASARRRRSYAALIAV